MLREHSGADIPNKKLRRDLPLKMLLTRGLGPYQRRQCMLQARYAVEPSRSCDEFRRGKDTIPAALYVRAGEGPKG